MTNQAIKNALAETLPLEALPHIDNIITALEKTGLYTGGTMDKIAWSDDVHRGMAAVDDYGETWIMQSEEDDIINLIHPETLKYVWAYKQNLTPTGTRYEFTPKRDHPEELDTLDDYENAPIGTIVAINSRNPLMKIDTGWEVHAGKTVPAQRLAESATAPAKVLRWGPTWG